jgi:arsenite-transporting ATPase
VLLDRPIVLFGGKGGVGKTTLATAYAALLAQRGERTLLVSTDPAHSTRDLLDAPLGPDPVAVPDLGTLEAVELDAEREAQRYVARVLRDAQATVSREVLPAVERHLTLAAQSPGTLEAALLDRLVEVLGWCPERYDRVVVDTAPTGHTLRLLALPTVLGPWLDGLVRQRERVADTDRMLQSMTRRESPAGGSADDRLARRRAALRATRARLESEAVFHLVTVPERLPVAETLRAAATLRQGGMAVGCVLVNRVLPDSADPFLRERGEEQTRRLAELETGLRDLVAGAPSAVDRHTVVRLPHLPHDAVSADDLAALAEPLAAAGL